MNLLISMGVRQRARAPLRARLVEIDADAGVINRWLDLPFNPAWHSGPDADDEATRGAWVEGRFLQPTHTALHTIDVESWSVAETWSHPRLHNVHSVAEGHAGPLLTCAGTDSVLQLNRDRQILHHHWLRDGDPAQTYISDDLRRVHHDGFKPHSHHPNCAWEMNRELWVTCFETREARAVKGSRRISLPNIPHDGSVWEGACWFTLVDGRVLAFDPQTLAQVAAVNVTEVMGAEGLVGWCRGLCVVGHRLFVGFTQLRSTRHREVLRWLASAGQVARLASRVVEIDLRDQSIVGQIALDLGAGGATIYGVTPAS